VVTTDDDDPLERFRRLMARALEAGETEGGSALTLATAGDGGPSVRYLLLKGVDAFGFVFFTNYDSRKGRELAADPRAAIAFWWPRLRMQIEARGPVERVSPADSDAYFGTRVRAKQLGAWASRQSQPLDNRARLVLRWLLYAVRFFGRRVSRPPFWGGFRLRPETIEFLTWGPDNSAERTTYLRTDAGWTIERDVGWIMADLAVRRI
jgi:pyridoxamine 5'-phosphate oxidase